MNTHTSHPKINNTVCTLQHKPFSPQIFLSTSIISSLLSTNSNSSPSCESLSRLVSRKWQISPTNQSASQPASKAWRTGPSLLPRNESRNESEGLKVKTAFFPVYKTGGGRWRTVEVVTVEQMGMSSITP